jgi:hypothetical protein
MRQICSLDYTFIREFPRRSLPSSLYTFPCCRALRSKAAGAWLGIPILQGSPSLTGIALTVAG